MGTSSRGRFTMAQPYAFAPLGRQFGGRSGAAECSRRVLAEARRAGPVPPVVVHAERRPGTGQGAEHRVLVVAPEAGALQVWIAPEVGHRVHRGDGNAA